LNINCKIFTQNGRVVVPYIAKRSCFGWYFVLRRQQEFLVSAFRIIKSYKCKISTKRPI